jgi:hypothetical protein
MALASLLSLSARSAADDNIEFFEKRIRSILAERCEACHSTAKGKTKGGLALDTRDGWRKGGDSGSPIVPGKPDESLLIQAVNYANGDLQMPPQEKGGKLPNHEIRLLQEWVERGAPDPRTAAGRKGGISLDETRRWWAFQPVRTTPPPTVKEATWPRTQIDHYVLAELEQRGIRHAAPADKRALLRRATFDLTGLPPAPDDLQAFLADNSDGAFEQVVDRLLASPEYGPRWARHWLDVVRYADYHDGNPKTRTVSCDPLQAWRYRDWVVEAFNRDLPFDQFIVHQIAGDLLPDPEGGEFYADGLVATTFLSNGSWDRGDADKEKMVSDMVDDNIDTVGKAFLGLTLGCARCHDHKFDPISQEDYYALAGVFYSTRILKELGTKGGEYTLNRVPLMTSAALASRAQQEQRLATVIARLEELDSRQRFLELTAGGQVLVPTEFMSASGATGTIAPDASVTVSGTLARDTYTVKAIVPEGIKIRIVRLEALSDAGLPARGPGRADDGNFVLSRLTAAFTPAGSEAPIPIKLVSARADFEQSGFAIGSVLDDNLEKGWAVHPAEGRDHVAAFEIAEDVEIPAGATLTFTIDQQHADSHSLGKFRFTAANALASATPQNTAERQGLVVDRDELQKELSSPVPLAEAAAEGGTPGGLFPGIQDVPIHIRGSYTRLGAIVPRRMPSYFAGENQPAIAHGSGRRELAAWIASAQNQLTARVIVNRVWQWHFGAGLVRTPNNFGLLSEPPSHPALLEWLAARFVEDGWSLKRLHRRIMLSAVYRQSSAVPRLQFTADPENRWLGRFAARRLEAEAIRDAMIFSSGRLDPTPRGPASDDLAIARRSLYVQTARWDRGSFAMLFDAANPDASDEKRNVSTVAPQALFLLNDSFTQGQAGHLAERLIRDVPGDSPNFETKRIQLAYDLLFSRPPTIDELSVSRQLLGQTPPSDAAWADLAHVLLCSNEFVYID